MSLNDQHELVFGGSAPAVLAIGTQPEIEMRSADVHQSQKDTELSGEVIRTDSLEGSGTDRESHVVPYYDDEEGHELYLQHLEDLGIAIPTENELDVIEDEDDLSASAATPVHNEDYHRQLSKVFTSTFTSFRDTDMATEEWIEQLNSWMVSLLPPTTSEGSSLWYRHRKTRYLWEMRDGRLRAVVDNPNKWLPIAEVDRWRYDLEPLSRREHRDLNSGKFPVEGHVWWTRFACAIILAQVFGLTIWFNLGLSGNMAEASSFYLFSITGWIIVALVVGFMAFISKMLAKYEYVLARRGEKRSNGFQAPWSPYQFFSMSSTVLIFQSFYAVLLPGIAGVGWPSAVFDDLDHESAEFWFILLLYTVPLTIVIASGLFMMWYNPSKGVKRGDSAERSLKADAASTLEQCEHELEMFSQAMAHFMHTPSLRCLELSALMHQAQSPHLQGQLQAACMKQCQHRLLTKWLVQTQWKTRWKGLVSVCCAVPSLVLHWSARCAPLQCVCVSCTVHWWCVAAQGARGSSRGSRGQPCGRHPGCKRSLAAILLQGAGR
eukprot:TRINITY_DN10869_c0_g1_i1.p1 TRINITY_DN10869_c0_g1~~TRINITY_DN10869_c0_g1_i1.p1  ORF type:complete len:548 (+),score=96.66 TRINITY_DN10869_c0_g1_i1:1-1644(+)